MEIIKNFGINPTLLAAQIVNFLIIFFVLKRFLYKPVLGMIKKREETIKEGLKKAEEAQLMMEETSKREGEILKKAQKEAQKIIEDTKKQAEEIARQNEEATRQQAERMLNEARQQIQVETQRVEQQLSANISKLAIQFLEKTSQQLFGEKYQKEIMSKALKQINKVD